MKKHSKNVLGGLILVAVGLWFTLDNLGVDLPGIDAMWPVFPMLGGLSLLWRYFSGTESDAGVMIPGIGGVLVGAFFFTITLGPLQWSDLDDWWPIFPVIGGVAFITMFAVSRKKDAGVLVPGVGGLLVGIFFFLITLGPLKWSQMGSLWPAFPLIGGIAFIVTWLADRRDKGLLFAGFLALTVGLVGFFFTIGELSAEWVVKGWPIVLILLGLIFVIRSFRSQ